MDYLHSEILKNYSHERAMCVTYIHVHAHANILVNIEPVYFLYFDAYSASDVYALVKFYRSERADKRRNE